MSTLYVSVEFNLTKQELKLFLTIEKAIGDGQKENSR